MNASVKKKNVLKIAIISKDDITGGGSGRVASTLAKLLNDQQNILVHHWVISSKQWQSYMRHLHGGVISRYSYKVFKVLSQKSGFSDFLTPELLMHLCLRSVNYDLYHFHNIATAFSPLSFRWIAKRNPTVWTFHDCLPFTGGCAHPSLADCTAFQTCCGNCPQLREWPLYTQFDFTGLMHSYKRKLAEANLFTPITPSNWLADEAMKSGMFKNKPVLIPNCVDSSIFKSFNKQWVRKKLGLPKHKFIVLLNSVSLANIHKGIAYAFAAIKAMPVPPYVVALGKNDVDQSTISGLEINFIGHIQDDAVLAQYYSAVDVFLFPTIAETFGNVAIEAMACETPVIAFATGGVPEIVDHDINGWLAPQKDVQGLVEGLMLASNEKTRLASWQLQARKKAIKVFNQENFLQSHLDVYSELLNNT